MFEESASNWYDLIIWRAEVGLDLRADTNSSDVKVALMTKAVVIFVMGVHLITKSCGAFKVPSPQMRQHKFLLIVCLF